MPVAAPCTILPAIVHVPVALNDTGSVELAVANTAKSGSPTVLAGSGANVMLWGVLATLNC